MKTMEVKWNDEAFEGKVIVKVSPLAERIKLQRELADAGEENGGDLLLAAANEVVEGIDLRLKSDKKVHIKTIDDLGYYEEGMNTVLALGKIKYAGVPLSQG